MNRTVLIGELVEQLVNWLFQMVQTSFPGSSKTYRARPLEQKGGRESSNPSTSSTPPASAASPRQPPESGIATGPQPESRTNGQDEASEFGFIEIKCPECGGPVHISEDMYSQKCGFCSSLLIIERQGDTLYFQVTNRIAGEQDVLKTLEDFYANRYYSELAAAARGPGTSSDDYYGGGEMFADTVLSEVARLRIMKKVNRLREQFSNSVRIEHLECFYAPYWHIDGIVGNGYLGRNKRTGAKSLKPRFYQLEFTSPAYDDEQINLRDTGLRISGSKIKMLHKSTAQENFPHLEPLKFNDELFSHAEFWFRRIPWGEIQPIQNKTQFLHRKAMLVFKPFWIVKYQWDGETYQHLLDGALRSVAGNLVYENDLNLPGYIRKDQPVYPEGDITAKMIASECPVCNHEQQYNSHHCIHFCNNCYRALEFANSEIRDIPYYCVGDGLVQNRNTMTLFMPFWAFELYITMGETSETYTLGKYLNILGKDLNGQPRCDPAENMIYIPALKYYGGKRPDDMFCKLTSELTWSRKQVIPEKINLDIKAQFMGATLTRKEALDIIPFLFYALLDTPTAMRMNKLTVQKYLENITIHTDTSFLILVPFQEQQRQFINPLLSFGIPQTFIGGTWVKEWIRTAYFRKRSQS